MMDCEPQSWESLKARAKSLKAELDAKMQELGRLHKRLGNAGARGSTSTQDRLTTLDGQIQLVVGLREEIEHGLGELADASEALSRVASPGAQAAQASRLRETQQELVRDFKRVAQSIDHQYQHARLLPKSRGGLVSGMDEQDESLMRERGSLNSSVSMADDIIGQALETRNMLAGQRRILTNANSKVGSIQSMFPGVDKLIDKISDRQTKERLILSFTVACCCCFTVWYKFM
eukprot:TRINITY_DN12556_c0_g1_i1.p1 TRINITY_DN12556_c0_g1~~TRINITY_DN12556_c0_g1_i1.p1  ORF type:complete len:233 (-),score=60.75 TRINITY_DN12556_c0_g1_i1:41-739(-)